MEELIFSQRKKKKKREWKKERKQKGIEEEANFDDSCHFEILLKFIQFYKKKKKSIVEKFDFLCHFS